MWSWYNLSMAHFLLEELVKEHALKFGDFDLSGGAKSHYFIDMSKITNHSEGLDIICSEIVRSIAFDSVGGPMLGAAPLVGGILVAHSRLYYGLSKAVRGFLVRKEPKVRVESNSTARSIELIEGDLRPGDKVLVVEDVVTTGGQTLRAIHHIESAGGNVVGVVAVVDRLAGAKELLAKYNFRSILTIRDLGL